MTIPLASCLLRFTPPGGPVRASSILSLAQRASPTTSVVYPPLRLQCHRRRSHLRNAKGTEHGCMRCYFHVYSLQLLFCFY